MASIVKGSLEPRHCPSISFSDKDDRAFCELRRENEFRLVRLKLAHDERYSPDEVPKRAFIYRENPKTIPDFVSISAFPAMRPEARAVMEEFEPGVHRFFPVEISRRGRSKKPIYRLDGRVLDTPYCLFPPQKWLDAVWV